MPEEAISKLDRNKARSWRRKLRPGGLRKPISAQELRFHRRSFPRGAAPGLGGSGVS
jgi:hypothetical protein